MSELAEGLEDEARQEQERAREFTPPAEPPPPTGAPTTSGATPRSRPAIGSRVTLTVIASGETTGGGALWIAALDTGGLVAVIPLQSVEGLAGV